ncbi:hypothetical protein [Nocardia suismassiliense]|uniref:hypothetical protein n=1 Tax=Nocardia suismassiliense TaxID=2077092 RepID=UPI000D1D5E89|nr:hypothetical protein [Nocardia suismassiliense]
MGWSEWQETSVAWHMQPREITAAGDEDVLRVIIRDKNDDLHEAVYLGNSYWASNENIGQPGGTSLSGVPALACIPDRRDLFVNGGFSLRHRSSTRPQSWTRWEDLGPVFPLPAGIGAGPAVCRSRWRMDIFALSATGPPFEMLHMYYDDNHGFMGWESLGGEWYDAPDGGFRTPAATTWGPDRIDVFAVGRDNEIHHQWTENAGVDWSGWYAIGGVTEHGLAACSWGPGRIDLFHRGTDASIYHAWLDADEAGWSGWEDMGGVTDHAVALGSRGRGRLDLLHIGTDDKIYLKEF